MKDTFVVYTEFKEDIDALDAQQKADLLDAMFAYHTDEEMPDMDREVAVIFRGMRRKFDKDAAKYHEVIEARRKAGSKGGKQKQANDSKAKQNVANGSKAKQNVANQAVYDCDYDNDCDYVITTSDNNSAPEGETVVTEVITHLNDKAGTDYPVMHQPYERLICDLIRQGVTKEQFITVIDKKVEEWKNTDFERNLRPETLFGNKFMTYLHAPKPKPKQNKFNNFEQRDEDYDEIAERLMAVQIPLSG